MAQNDEGVPPDDPNRGEARPQGVAAAPRAIVVMGVSGSGKTTIGRRLADRLGWDFEDADTFHPPENIAKMARGIPLDDDDRAPWLARLRHLLEERLTAGRSVVLACSALKRSYRRALEPALGRMDFVYLRGSYDLILARLRERRGHYMKPGMLESQFAALEEPSRAITVAVDAPPAEIVARIVEALAEDRGADPG